MNVTWARFALAMDDTPDRSIAAVAAAQHGVFTQAQADAAGFRRDQREFRVRAGRWQVVQPGLYRISGTPESWHARVLAACWAPHSFAVASHRTAAELWDLPGGRTDLVELTCRRGRRARSSELIVHETKLLEPGDTTEIEGIPVTTIDQTLLGLAAVVRPAVVEMALDRALLMKRTTRASLDSFVQRKRGQGRNGVAVLRGLLDARDPLAGVPESAMETRLKQLLRRHGLPTPVFQHVIRDQGRFVARVDAAYPELRIAIEFDSYEHHTGKLALVRDNDRRNQLTGINWRTVTFTAADVQRDGGQAIEALLVARREARTEASGVAGA
jgi:very-short-patch-repair endonuclease